jgi:K+-sensing histidine kinase KdpD
MGVEHRDDRRWAGGSGRGQAVEHGEPHGRQDRFATLHEISLEVYAARTIDDVFRVLSGNARWLIDHEIALAAMADRTRRAFECVPLSTAADASEVRSLEFPQGTGAAGSVLASQAPLLLDLPDAPSARKMAEDDPLLERLADAGMRTALLVPLTTGQETIGVLAFASELPLAYDARDMVIAQMLAAHTGVTLKNVSLLDETQRRMAQIELVNELSQRVTGSLELAPLLQSVAESVRSTFRFFDVACFLVEPATQEVILAAHSGEAPDFLPSGYRQKMSEGIVGWVATHGERLLVNDVEKDPRYVSYAYQETASELALPIRLEGKVVGVLNVEDLSQGAFDETDAIVLETLCDQLGGAIRNVRLYEKLKATNAKLQEVDRMKSDFLGIVSHDFRTPLSTIVLAASSLQKRWEMLGREKVEEYLAMIVDQGTKLANLAEDVLSISRMEAGKLSYYFSTVNLDRVVRDAASMVKFSSRHSLESSIDQGHALVRADQAKLRQVVQNLLSNAVKYSPAGGPIRVRVKNLSAEFLQVSVEDEGVGIPENQMGKLFQKFSRLESEATRSIAGSGLGLWICKEIVKAHGGEIWAERRLGQGTVFSFTVKKAQPGSPA